MKTTRQHLAPAPARESGQALMELLAMLLGLAVLIIGIVVFSAYQSAENTILLRSKFRTEKAARDGDQPTAAGLEIGSWRRRSANIYGSGPTVDIPFTAGDRVSYTQESAINGINGELASDARSTAVAYRYDALYPSQFTLRKSDLEDISVFSSFDAARMITRDGSGAADDGGTVSGDRLYASGLLVDVFKKLIGRLPSPDRNETNKVYLPLHDENQ